MEKKIQDPAAAGKEAEILPRQDSTIPHVAGPAAMGGGVIDPG